MAIKVTVVFKGGVEKTFLMKDFLVKTDFDGRIVKFSGSLADGENYKIDYIDESEIACLISTIV